MYVCVYMWIVDINIDREYATRRILRSEWYSDIGHFKGWSSWCGAGKGQGGLWKVLCTDQ